MAITAPSRPDPGGAALGPAMAEDHASLLGEGFVRLDDAMADDRSVVNSARVSFGVRKDELDDADRGLIRFLMRERHGTPYEHNAFRFHVRCPIFVAREWMRHRLSSFNELSGRYAEIPDSFYVPAAEDVRSQVGRPGAYRFEAVEAARAERARDVIDESYRAAYAAYQALLDDGIAREVARTVLPVGINTEFYWTVNARSLMNFLSLRNAETAQREIRRYAEAVELLFAARMPLTHEAFVDGGRVAP